MGIENLQPGHTLYILQESDLEKIAEKIASKFIEDRNDLVAAAPEQKQEKPLTQLQAAEFLGKSRQTLISWRKKGIIQGKRLGGRIYYFESELLDAMKR